MLGQLNEQQMNNLLASQVVGRLACTDSTQPYLVPVTYAFDGTYIYGQTNEGMKLNLLRNNPNVCFEVDAMTNMANWQSVIVKGTFEELTDEDAENARTILKNRVFPMMTSATIDGEQHEVESELDDSNRLKRVMYRISIAQKTGRFEKR
ncbi:pyridoxamine 5'-phosphate oxidase family protein [Lacibacter sp. H407]|uniref:pyridoxamine 5'-phosphate oxidase family protein n=1 Tax=Lacibacter sp. H407 TaxID=3133423 RepID=UPI0030BCB519